MTGRSFAFVNPARLRLAALAGVAVLALPVAAQSDRAAEAPTASPVAKPVFEEDGTVIVPSFELPPSDYLSDEARAQQAARGKMPSGSPDPKMDIAMVRMGVEMFLAPQVKRTLDRYPVNIEESTMNGVRVRTVTPREGAADPDRVLINVHGGAFSICAEACAMLESVPIAALGKFKVVTVDYRMAPEHKHPAGVEDLTSVYKALLQSYQPGQIGVYGCSAGGTLSAQAAAWLPAKGLPQMGAVGIFGAGAVRFGTGDSAYIAGYIDGAFAPPSKTKDGHKREGLDRGYFDGVLPGDPIVESGLNPEVLAQFPPTMIVTGTRAMDLSPAIVTNSALIKAGIDTRLIVGEGMGHCYIYSSDLPEARDAQQAIVDFFKDNLARQ